VDDVAHCIDLEMLAGRQDLYDLRLGLGPGGSGLAVLDGAERVTVIDTTSFEPVSATVEPQASSAGSSGWRWLLALLAGAVILVSCGALALRRRGYSWRSSVPSRPRT
jgi:hypothetical protein